VLAHLLSYPDAELRSHLDELGTALRQEQALSAARLGELDTLLQRLARRDALDTEAEFVELFDRGRGTALHLFRARARRQPRPRPGHGGPDQDL
jgi:nitrate reductase delta subunit